VILTFQTLFTFLQNEEFNCTEPSPSVSLPCRVNQNSVETFVCPDQPRSSPRGNSRRPLHLEPDADDRRRKRQERRRMERRRRERIPIRLLRLHPCVNVIGSFVNGALGIMS
jgi:hypothetical protein